MDVLGYFSYLGINCILGVNGVNKKIWGKGIRIKR